jgi:hypothetical protein
MGVAAPGTIPWKGVQLVHRRDLDNPVWSKAFRKRRLRELPPSTSTQLSLMSFTKVIGTSDHLRYLGVAGPTAMTSWAFSFCFLLGS